MRGTGGTRLWCVGSFAPAGLEGFWGRPFPGLPLRRLGDSGLPWANFWRSLRELFATKDDLQPSALSLWVRGFRGLKVESWGTRFRGGLAPRGLGYPPGGKMVALVLTRLSAVRRA